jgi:Zn-dependent membrane protease YugP
VLSRISHAISSIENMSSGSGWIVFFLGMNIFSRSFLIALGSLVMLALLIVVGLVVEFCCKRVPMDLLRSAQVDVRSCRGDNPTLHPISSEPSP